MAMATQAFRFAPEMPTMLVLMRFEMGADGVALRQLFYVPREGC
jgi:hypothetical protein